MNTFDLLGRADPTARGDLVLRFGFPLLTLALGLLAIPLAITNVRSGRAVNLILALLIYLIASNLFGAAKGAVSQDKINMLLALTLVPGILFMVTALMFWWRTVQMPSLLEMMYRLKQRGRDHSQQASAG